jgi:hypothetical protein
VIPELERIGYRAALSLSCIDAVRGTVVADGLVATTWRTANPAARFVATRSRISGLLGFGLLPRLREQQYARTIKGAPLVWPANPQPDPYVVKVVDTQRRYLPVVMEVPVPVATPVEVPLHSAVSRPATSGWAVVRGEVHHRTTTAPVPWTVLTVDTGADSYAVVGDQRGRFLLIAPYPEALPPLVGSPPAGPGLGAMTWSLTMSLRSKPDDLVAAPGTDWDRTTESTDPPELASILGQPLAQQEVGGLLQPSSTAALAFGTPIVLNLLIQPA